MLSGRNPKKEKRFLNFYTSIICHNAYLLKYIKSYHAIVLGHEFHLIKSDKVKEIVLHCAASHLKLLVRFRLKKMIWMRQFI